MATLHIHHHGHRYTTSHPLGSRTGEILHECHVTRLTSSDEVSSGITKTIAVVCIEITWHCAATFVTEEVVERREFALVGTRSLELSKTLLYHLDEQFLGFDLANHHIAVRVTIQGQLLSNTLWQTAIEFA